MPDPVTWHVLADWWIQEVRSDPAYESVVTPLLIDLLVPTSGFRHLDIGCGEGRVMRTLAGFGATVDGLDINPSLAREAGRAIVGDLLEMPIRDDAYDGVYSVLTLEHIEDHRSFFIEAARVTRPAGVLALVVNHPVWTAPDSTPISDTDGEVLWRPGHYFSQGSSQVPAGDSTVTFHHRTVSELANGAADAGWSLEHMVEQPHPDLEDQQGIPRLLGVRWRLLR